jgi:hypothetical protein
LTYNKLTSGALHPGSLALTGISQPGLLDFIGREASELSLFSSASYTVMQNLS